MLSPEWSSKVRKWRHKTGDVSCNITVSHLVEPGKPCSELEMKLFEALDEEGDAVIVKAKRESPVVDDENRQLIRSISSKTSEDDCWRWFVVYLQRRIPPKKKRYIMACYEIWNSFRTRNYEVRAALSDGEELTKCTTVFVDTETRPNFINK